MGTGTFSPGLKRKCPSPYLVKTLRMSTAIHILCLHNMLQGDICFTFIFAFTFTLTFTFTIIYTFTFTPDIACRNCNKLKQKEGYSNPGLNSNGHFLYKKIIDYSCYINPAVNMCSFPGNVECEEQLQCMYTCILHETTWKTQA